MSVNLHINISLAYTVFDAVGVLISICCCLHDSSQQSKVQYVMFPVELCTYITLNLTNVWAKTNP